MARQSTTRLQISGHRFLMRRTGHALVRRDVRMLDDPIRAQSLSLVVGAVLAVIALAGCALLAVARPKGALGDAPIVMVRDSGAVYVRIDDVMHPVLNLASARLIAGTSAKPELVSASAIDNAKRGPTVGIPGAPDTIAIPLDSDESGWSTCEDATSATTVIAGARPDPTEPAQSVLVSARGEGAATTFLLYDGRRARVDLRDHAVVRALRLEGVVPRAVSRALLDTIPESPPIAAPRIALAGTAGSRPRGFAIGTVVRLHRAGSVDHYVVLVNGVQRISEVTADLIRFTHPHGRREIVTVAPAIIGSLPVVDDLPVTTFPAHRGVSDGPVLCAHWTWSTPSSSVNTVVSVKDSLPVSTDDTSVTLAQSDESGPAVDNVTLLRGRSVYARAAGVTGEGAQTGALYLVTASGVVYGVRDEEAAKRLGLTDAPVPAPWPLLARLARGPELSVESASVMRDGVTSPS